MQHVREAVAGQAHQATVPRRLAGKRAVVTGGGSGIGRASAVRLAAEGARVVVADVRDHLAEETVALISDAGDEASWQHCDVADEEQVRTLMTDAVERLGGGLDVLVTSAGIGGGRGCVHELTHHDWQLVLAVNLSGTFLSCKYAIPGMLSAGGGSIVTISSVAGVVVSGGSTAAYKASKAGVIQLTRQVAVEYAADGIRANCVCPGLVRTRLGEHNREIAHLRTTIATRPRLQRTVDAPIPRAADPAEIAGAVAFLASGDASFITGSVVLADGGFAAI